MPLVSGSRLGPYEIVAPIGAGGMGEVYRARDPRLGREIAVKVLPAEVSSDRDRLKRFEQEARSASALNHPNLITIYDIGQSDSSSYIAMELVEGKSLRELLAAGPLPVKKIFTIATQIAEGLAKAHAAGIVHRDLKPENVMVTPDGRVKILDFGLAKLAPAPIASALESLAPTLTQQTTPGVILGTVGYMSPEQARGHAVDFRSDQFSFGAILHEMASGKRAFQRGTAVETLSAILKDEPAPLSAVNPAAPELLQWILDRCLSKDPEERYGSTKDLARDLASLRDRGSATAASRSALPLVPTRAKRIALWIAGALILVGLLVGAGLFFRSRKSSTGGADRARSIAVLPFQNFGGRAEDEYFSDGMTESLITELAKVQGMLVIARNSVFQYKGQKTDIKKVGDELDVNYVLEGSVQRAGDQVRVNAQLIDARSGYHVWADKFDRPAKDLFALQDEISRNIAGAMKITLAPSAGGRTQAPTSSLEAYDAYLRGIFYANKFAWQEKDKGIPFLERATALDPQFAQAHAALAGQYARKSFERDPERKWEEKGFVEIERALSIDPNLPQAYLARGALSWTLLNRFPYERAAADFHRALELNPNLGSAHSLLASLYMHVGLLEKALEEYRVALRIDPHDRDSLYRIPRIHFYQQKYAESLAGFDAVPEFRKDFQKPLVLAHLGRMEEAVALVETVESALDEKGRISDMASTHAVLLARSEDAEGAERKIAVAIENGRGRSHFHHAAYNIACAYTLMEKKMEALAWLERTAEEGMPCYPLFEKDPHLDNLRGDPEFAAFMNRIKSQWERFRRTL